MPLDFPTSPTNGQYYNGFVYNAANETWDSAYAPRAATIPISSPNYVINGGFDIWQRGTSATLGSTGLTNYYTADRWATFNPTGTGTLARDTTNVPAGIQYGLRFTASAANSSCNFYHTIETLNASQLAGKTVTLSLWLSGTAGASVQVALLYSTGVDTAWTSSFTNISGPNFTITATPTRYSFTATVPANAKTLQVFVGSGTLANTNFVSFTGVQLEEGAAATDFRRNAPSIQGELAACQRYYERRYYYGIGWGQNSTVVRTSINHYVQKRATPSVSFVSGTIQYGPGGTLALSSVSAYEASSDGMFITYVTPGGQTVNLPSLTAALLEVSAEL